MIDPRFNGPPGSGNGGYVCGELAKTVDRESSGALESGVCVRLHRSAATAREFEIVSSEDGCALFDGESLIGQARAQRVDIPVPDAVSVAVATRAARGFRGHDEHVFPECFVCGPNRREGDGMRIFPGALPESLSSIPGVFAAPWQPDPTLEGESGMVDPSFVWAALDCPGAFSFPQPDGAIVLLGEMSAALPGRVKIDESSVLLSWQIEVLGRKHFTGTAIFDAQGRCSAVAHTTWIETPGRSHRT